MSDTALASSVASTAPRDLAADAADPENFLVSAAILGNSSVAPAVKPVIDEAALVRKFDGRMHGRMSSAKTEMQWDEIFAILTNAHTNKNLRANVRDRFLKECPHQAKTDTLRDAVGLKKAKPVDVVALNQRFDERLIERMDDAHSRKFWAGILETLLAAKENKNLRPSVREHFTETCPFPDMVKDLRTAIVRATLVVKKKSKKK